MRIRPVDPSPAQSNGGATNLYQFRRAVPARVTWRCRS